MIRIDSTAGERIPEPSAVALGFFDGVHLGHKAVISRAVDLKRERGLVPCVFTFSCSQSIPISKRNQKLIATEGSKERWIEQLGAEYLAVFNFDQVKEYSGEKFVSELLMGKLHAKALCCGEDFRFGKNASGDVAALQALCRKENIDLYIVKKVLNEGIPVSSTRIRALIESGEMESAAKLMGKCFSIDFEVIYGRQLGRRLDFPTINQVFESSFVLPRFGVYATYTVVNGVEHPSVTNVGIKPTVGSEYPLAETYILNYEGNLYGQSVEVCFLKYLRPEIKFDDISALKRQIGLDIKSAESFFAER